MLKMDRNNSIQLNSSVSRLVSICFDSLVYLNYYIIGYPRVIFSEEKLKKFEVSDEEININRTNGTNLLPSHRTAITLFLFLFLYHSNYPLYTVSVHNEFNKQNINFVSTNKTMNNIQRKIGCLNTDCSLVEDFRSIHVFYLCHPSTRFSFHFTARTHVYGLVLESILCCLYFLLGVVIPIYYYIVPTTQPFAVFTLLPITTQRILCDTIRKHLMGINISMIHYYQQSIDLDHSKRFIAHQNDEESTDEEDNYNYRHESLGVIHRCCFEDEESENDAVIDRYDKGFIRLHLQPELSQLRTLNKSFCSLDQYSKTYIADCLTVYRTNWWKNRVITHFVMIYLQMFFGTICLATYLVVTGSLLLHDRKRDLYLLGQRLKSSNCTIWFADKFSSDRYVDLSEFDLGHTMYSIAELSLFLMFFLSVSGYLLAHTVVGVQDMKFQVIEQIDRVKLAITMTEIMEIFGAESFRTKGINLEIQSSYSPFKKIRAMHRDSFKDLAESMTKYSNPFSSRTMIQSGLVYEENLQTIVIEQLIEQRHIDLDNYLSLLIKIYVGFKLLHQAVRDNELNTSAILFNGSVLTLSSEFVVIYFAVKYNLGHTVVIAAAIIGFASFTTIILPPSSIQATAKQLFELMWQLLAAQTHYKDMRIRHIRMLLFRQTAALCQNNGLSLKAYGKPVTYEFIIRVIIWSSSFFILATGR